MTATRITLYRKENGRRVSLLVSRIGLIEDVSKEFRGTTTSQVQYPMPNGAKYVTVRDSFDAIHTMIGVEVRPEARDAT